MGHARNVGGIRARAGRDKPPKTDDRATPLHYLTSREAAALARFQRAKDEARGIFRRWNDRKIDPHHPHN